MSYSCLFCNYYTNNKYNFNKHTLTNKHILNEKKIIQPTKNKQKTNNLQTIQVQKQTITIKVATSLMITQKQLFYVNIVIKHLLIKILCIDI